MLLSTRTAAVLLAMAASPALACPSEDWMDRPYFGEIVLNYAYEVDPFRMTVRGGGQALLRDCGLEGDGFIEIDEDVRIDQLPDVVLNWEGIFPRLAVATEFERDSVLLIRDPEGNWHFNDDSEGDNPQVVFTDPPEGAYVIFIGTHGVTPTRPGDLIITLREQ